MDVILRSLEVQDAEVSWKWRNDPEVWKLTGRKWNSPVTKEIEEKWIAEVNERPDEKRFAICVGEEKVYIGNVQLTSITQNTAVFHIFIGDKNYWGKGVATKATQQLLDFAFKVLNLEEVRLKVKKQNDTAIRVYQKVGFFIYGEIQDDLLMKVVNAGQ